MHSKLLSPFHGKPPDKITRRERKSSWGSSNSIRSRSLSPHRNRASSSSPLNSPSPTLHRFSWALLTPTFGNHSTVKHSTAKPLPVLTTIMNRLEGNLSSYCDLLAKHKLEEAAALLDSSVSVSASAPQIYSSTKALESEWDTYVSPFLLLAGAESLYHSLAPNLLKLYNRITDDLVIVKERLCDAFLEPESPLFLTANSLATSLQLLVLFCKARIQLIRMMEDLFQINDIAMAHDTCASLFVEDTQDSAVYPLIASLNVELKNWIRCTQVCHALEACRFTETILTLRQINIKFPDESPMQQWWKQFREGALSIMPIYFDRIRSSAQSLYGFDPFKLERTPKHDAIDVTIQEFLKRQEGHITAVFIVMNNTDLSCPNFEYGYVQRKSVQESNKALQEWPVCYYRRSMERASAIASLVNLGSSGKRTPDNSPNSRGPLSSCKEDGKRLPTMTELARVDPYLWPFTEWKDLASVLQDGGSRETAVTYKSSNDSDDPDKSPPPTTWSDTSNGELPVISTSPTNTTFHIISLSPLLSFVVAVHGPHGKWNLRRSRGSSDAEIRNFLDGTVNKLRIRSFLDNRHVMTARQEAKQKSKLPFDELNGDMQGFLKSLKDSYGLRTQTPRVERLTSPYRKSDSRNPAPVAKRKTKRAAADNLESSAMAFFLGSELHHRLP